MARAQVTGRRGRGGSSSQRPTTRKRARTEVEHNGKGEEDKNAQSSSKKQKSKPTESADNLVKNKADALLSKYGSLPLADLGLPNPSSPTPENVLALVYNAMLTSTRISHQLAHKTVKCVVEAGYQDIETLSKSTWEERTEVLTEGGYTRYREKTATAFGELAEFVKDKYDGDLNNLLKKADSSPSEVRKLLKEIKGIGNVGVDIFCDTAQHIWPCLAPFIDPRSMKTAQQCGLGNDLEEIWEAIGKDPEQMCKLAAALTTVRLEKKEKEFA
ncbi:MAG: hypothetical protein LQ338_004762 [Usnochroma carphineum]|nr:MAG: hypothetical protein LQ338_004762 [Usnochroma carphineum]